MTYITVGDAEYTREQAQTVIAGYAFGTVPSHWSPKKPRVGPPPAQTSQHRWAYTTYDCVPPDPGDIGPNDVIVTAAINSRIGAKTILSVMAVAPEISETLARIPTSVNFWDQAEEDLREPPAPGTATGAMWRAWYALMGVRGVDVAVCHKILHHKRPCLYPLLDGITEGAYQAGKAWAEIHRELTTHHEQFHRPRSMVRRSGRHTTGHSTHPPPLA